MRASRRALTILAATLVVVGLHALGAPAPAAANHNQIAIIEDDLHVLSDPMGTLERFRSLGTQMVRVFVNWAAISPNPFDATMPAFNPSDPAQPFQPSDPTTYPAGAWDRWDEVDRVAHQLGMQLDFVVTGGSPHWGQNAPANEPEPADSLGNPNRAWYPDARLFGQFAEAVGRRYDGTFADPQNPGQTLPRVSFWTIWNEPNFGEDLAPEGIDGSKYLAAPAMYRSLVNAGLSALTASGHGRDRIIIGEFAARGMTGRVTRRHPQGLPGNYGQTKPLQFIRALYCLDGRLKPLRGRLAAMEGCPTNRAGTRRFRAQNPGLFKVTAFSDHPYPQNEPPTKERSHDRDFAAFSELPNMEALLDAAVHAYGGRTHYAIYNDEYGYITRPPNPNDYVSPTTAAYYLNWAEYLSWRSQRIASTMQYLLYDPGASGGGFDSGLLFPNGREKPTYGAYRLPLYLPDAVAGRSTEVWGCVRPAPYARRDTGAEQFVLVQYRSRHRGSWRTVARVRITNGRGYFDTQVHFPGPGAVRLSWSYPSGDVNLPGGTITSRTAPLH